MPWMNLRIRSERVFSQVPTFKSRNNQSVAIDAATRAMRIVANRMIWRPENQREARYADVAAYRTCGQHRVPSALAAIWSWNVFPIGPRQKPTLSPQ